MVKPHPGLTRTAIILAVIMVGGAAIATTLLLTLAVPADARGRQDQEESGSPTLDASLLNTECPVMPGRPVTTEFSVVYQGKTVLFCCPGCPGMFLENPEQYVSLLPQFASTEGTGS